MTREETINIAEILKDKPQGTKLYSPAFGECTLYSAECLNVLDKDKIKHSFMGSGISVIKIVMENMLLSVVKAVIPIVFLTMRRLQS